MCGEQPGPRSGFEHSACLYGSDKEFLEMAVPFLEDGIAAGEPVLAVTTAHNLEALSRVLGDRARHLRTAESAYFGRRPVDRVTAFLIHWDKCKVAGRRMRMIAEPVWHGKSEEQIAEWKGMESGLNVLLAHTDLSMVCPYDTRSVPSDILVAARATHPKLLNGTQPSASTGYTEPHAYALAVRPPTDTAQADVATIGPTSDIREVRRFAREQAMANGLSGDTVAVTELVVHEVAVYLLGDAGDAAGNGRIRVVAWPEPGVVVWELRQEWPGPRQPGPFAGFMPPGDRAHPEDGLWLTRTLSRSMSVRALDTRLQVRLTMADGSVVEHP